MLVSNQILKHLIILNVTFINIFLMLLVDFDFRVSHYGVIKHFTLLP